MSSSSPIASRYCDSEHSTASPTPKGAQHSFRASRVRAAAFSQTKTAARPWVTLAAKPAGLSSCHTVVRSASLIVLRGRSPGALSSSIAW